MLDRVSSHARASYAKDEEACGYLTGPASDALLCDEAVPLANLANRYHELDPETYPRTGRMYFFIDPLEVPEGGQRLGRPTDDR